jgi:hypothetical protein
MTTFRVRFIRCHEGAAVNCHGCRVIARAERALMPLLRQARAVPVDTLDDGTDVWEIPAPTPRPRSKRGDGFAAFCRPRFRALP